MDIIAWIVALPVTALVGSGLFRLIFEDADDFWDCVKYSFTPDLVSMFRGEYGEDMMQSLKLSFFLLLTIGAGGLTWWGISSLGN